MTQKELFDKASSTLLTDFGVDAVWFVPVHGKGCDVFGLYDMLALWRGRVCFIQITTLNNEWTRKKKVEKFREKYQTPTNSFVMAWDYTLNDFRISWY